MLVCTRGAHTSWTARTTTAIELIRVRCFLLLALLASAATTAGNVRDHTRPGASAGTAVSSQQAVDVTLTLSAVAVRPIQSWVRTAATLTAAGTALRCTLQVPDADQVRVGQRARAFPLESRSSMTQAKVTHVLRQPGGALIELALPGTAQHLGADYLLEIVVDRGAFLSVANEAIIEEDGKQFVYVPRSDGEYERREILTGLQGELYTQMLQGLSAGEQVVTIGSFFVDAEHKMKAVD
jgi:hypothetical protein